MLNDLNNLNSMHFDILREVGNIGAGNAVTSLAKMLGAKVDMLVPKVNLVGFKNITDFLGGPETIVIGILVGITGDINGIMMFIVQKDAAHSLLNIIMQSDIENSDNFNEMELSALTEIGNILTSAYINSLSGLIDKKISPSIPFLSIDMANAILSVPAIEFGKVSDNVLLIESVFNTDKDNVTGYFLLIPDMPSFNVILSSLGVG